MNKEDIDKAFNGRWRIKNLHQLYGEEVRELCRDFFDTGIILASEEVGTCASNHVTIQEADEEAFDKWWELYDKKCGRKDCIAKWKRLSYEEKKSCIVATPAYVAATPDKQYRKNPLTYKRSTLLRGLEVKNEGVAEKSAPPKTNTAMMVYLLKSLDSTHTAPSHTALPAMFAPKSLSHD